MIPVLPTLTYRGFLGFIGLLLRFDVKLVGVDNIPCGPCIATSNHPNREEILLGYRIFRRPVRIILDDGLMEPVFIQTEFRKALSEQYRLPRWTRKLGVLVSDWLARQNRRLGCIPVARDPEAPGATSVNRRAFRLAIEALKRGEVIGMAPEGSISPESGVGILQRGASELAWHFARRGEDIPVLPIIFYGITGLKHSLFGRGRVVIALGKPLYFDIDPGEQRREAVERFTSRLHENLVELHRRVSATEPELVRSSKGS